MSKTCPEPTPKEGALSPVLSPSKERPQALPASVATSAEVARRRRLGEGWGGGGAPAPPVLFSVL